MSRIRALEKKYGTVSSTGKLSAARQTVLNRAIRAELLGGNILLDLNEVMFLLGGQKKWSEECRQFARFCSTAIGTIKREMVEEIEQRYTKPVGREGVEKFIEELDVITKAKKLNEDTLETLNYVREQAVFMLAEMDGTTEMNGKTREEKMDTEQDGEQ